MKSFSELTSASQVNNDDLLAISQTSGSGYASKKTTVKDITDKSNLNLAEEYDSTSTYAVDDYVIYESVLYKCIASTTGTFDSTKWTSVVVTDEMGSGGGGGTGGHTIIDENGNSMTARAGLQFVGGANVEDDATNNKTIVDLASAGGIDGVFIDTDNVIVQETTLSQSSVTYTATQDCAMWVYLVVNRAVASVSVDGVAVFNVYGGYSGNLGQATTIFLKKGQVATMTVADTSNSKYAVYGIQTGTTHSKFQPVIYSTEEREIGVWTDGKPLYQKTIVLASSMSIASNTWTDIDDGDWSFVDTFVLGLMVNSNGASVGFVAVDKNTNNNKLRILQTRSTDITCKSVTIQYTKTSDTAGSGSWTPQGVPTHHYSTDEQVIGTWIDGKTLYEKTFDYSSSPILLTPNTWLDSGIPSSLNIDKLVGHILRTESGVYSLAEVTKGASNYTVGVRNDMGINNRNMYYLTIQYTKTV